MEPVDIMEDKTERTKLWYNRALKEPLRTAEKITAYLQSYENMMKINADLTEELRNYNKELQKLKLSLRIEKDNTGVHDGK